MCGIIAVLRQRTTRIPPDPATVLGGLDQAMGVLSGSGPALLSGLAGAASAVEEVDALLRGAAGLQALLGGDGLRAAVAERIAAVDARIAAIDLALDAGELDVAPGGLEAVNASLVRLKDAAWAIGRDRLRNAEAVADLAGEGAGLAAIEGYASVQVALSALDRLEVRGRDSAGIHLLVTGHGLDLDAPDVRAELERRNDPLFGSGAARAPLGHLSFVYKAAAEIGELGDNSRVIRDAVRADGLLRRALVSADAQVTVLGHTRWASVGIISQANAHPLNHEELDRDSGPFVTAALNGDVDNHAELRLAEGLSIAPEMTTDAKVIPTLVSRRRAEGLELDEAFRRTVASFEGSVAIGASAAEAPASLHLALRGSGQALYVGLADELFVVASEPYGLVEETSRYVRMDGETASGRDGSAGQILILDGTRAGSLEGIRRLAYDGTELPLTGDDVHTAEITTRDIDRAGAPHFLLKEIGESPTSVRKTLRGKVVERAGQLAVQLDEAALPPGVRSRLERGEIDRVIVIGQGTAAIAGQSLAAILGDLLTAKPIAVSAQPATELSGFGLDDDMSSTLVIAISQSGTTTDTNRTVDLVRSRGAAVLAIVNRRNSDLVERADGVLYTSDGRDVEMAVPSTKAFYAQIAAGLLLAVALADAAGAGDSRRTSALLADLRTLPAAMEQVLARRDDIAIAAQRYAPSRRYWAVVGSGLDLIAAQELRIKLSELCYKSMSWDTTEDKKHIDLSSEPLILVCAAGVSGANADDISKEVAIYRAHKAAPIVIATEGERRYPAALHVIEVPPVHPSLGFVLSAMAGHLFGYEAALAIDAQARPLREARAAVEELVTVQPPLDELLERLARGVETPARQFFEGLRSGAYNGHLEASTAVRLSSLLRYAIGVVPVEAYELEYGKVGSPTALVEDLIDALTRAIEELTRPIDAIKHQAKTVTVGISRAEDSHLDVPLVKEVLAVGTARDRLSYRSLRTLAELNPAVARVTGYTRYQIEGSVSEGNATIHVLDKGGVARDIASRAEREPALVGTKHRVADQREVTVARGRRDGRTMVIVPETKDNQVTGLTLLHAEFAPTLDATTARKVLAGYQGRYSALVDAVTETEERFDDSLLAEIPVIDLLVEPVYVLAERWRTPR